MKDHKAEITAIRFNPNGNYIVTSSLDKTIKVWDIGKQRLVATLLGHQEEVIKIDQSYQGDLILSCSFDYTAKIWDLKTNNCVRSLAGHKGEVNCCKF